jgi:protein-S-isoprenylcysteine O-methyltransferase Ste14
MPSMLLGLIIFSNASAALQEHGAAQLFRVLSTLLWTLFLIMVVRRPKASAKDRSLFAVLAVAGSCIASVFFALTDHVDTAWRLYAADVFLISGSVFSIYATITLGRCFSLMADARAVITKGPYRLVRHPLYLGEITTLFGFVIVSPYIVLTLGAWLAVLVIQMVRAHYEERTLGSAFGDYATYANTVQYRVIPGVY